MQYLNSLKDYLNNFSPVKEEDWSLFTKTCRVEKYSEKQTIHNLGDVFDSVKFICDGLVRSFLIDSDGKDFTWSIHYNDTSSHMKNLFVVDYASYIESQPSDLSFETIEPTVLISIKKSELELLHNRSLYWANISSAISGMAYCATHHRTISLLTKTAKERYAQLLKDNPSFLKTVPQYYVASYLGIMPQSLSRLKKEIENG